MGPGTPAGARSIAAHAPWRRRGNVLERPRRCLSGHQIKYPADLDAGRRAELTSVGAQENYINGFSGTHLLAGDLGLRKTQYFQWSKRALPPSWCLLIRRRAVIEVILIFYLTYT